MSGELPGAADSGKGSAAPGILYAPDGGIRGVSFLVHGRPAPQGSKRYVGRGIMVESSRQVTPWRNAVVAAAERVLSADSDWQALPGALLLSISFGFAHPRSHYTAKGVLRPNAPKHPAVRPDLSKLIRSTEDALTDVGVWRDDAQVVGVTVSKWYRSVPETSITVVRL